MSSSLAPDTVSSYMLTDLSIQGSLSNSLNCCPYMSGTFCLDLAMSSLGFTNCLRWSEKCLEKICSPSQSSSNFIRESRLRQSSTALKQIRSNNEWVPSEKLDPRLKLVTESFHIVNTLENEKNCYTLSLVLKRASLRTQKQRIFLSATSCW